MKPRRRKGATLGLIAVSVLVIIVIGVGCYFLAKLCGGGREVANSTDAGTLNVAKAALRSANVTADVPNTGGYANFGGCADPNYGTGGNKITLFTYNRCVAQALLIALNAQEENWPTSTANANQVWQELQTIGQDLSTKLQNQAALSGAFTSVANSNSMKMFGNNAVNETDYKWAYMKPGGSTNVWFSQYTFNNSDANAGVSYTFPSNQAVLSQLVNSGPLDKVPDGTKASPYSDLGASGNGKNAAYQNKYMAGYQPIGPVIGHTFVGVPVFPQQKPHLVSLGEFTTRQANPEDPNGWAPPNSFKVQSSSKDSKTGSFGGAVACAIVGAVQMNAGAGGVLAQQADFIGQLPMGYIQIVNDAPYGGAPPNWGGPGDGTNNIFNWELNPVGGGPGVNMTSNANGDDVFFQDTGSAGDTIQSWADYNAAGQPAAPATWNDTVNNNPTQTGAPQGSLAGIFVAINGGQSSRPATVADMNGIGGKGQNCLQDLIQNNMGYPGTPTKCGSNLNAMSSAFGRSMGGGTGGGNQSGPVVYWSNVDAIKQQICQAFNTPYVSVSAPGGRSGLGAYKVAKPAPNQAPAIAWNAGEAPPLEKTSTVMDLLTQVGGCATGQVLRDIWQRANEIAPGTSYNDVVNLLRNTNIGMGQSLFIMKSNPRDPMSALQITSTPQGVPATVPNPDGNPNGPTAGCDSGSYDLYQGGYGLVDTKVGSSTGDGKGDNNLHDQPYTNVSSNLSATDHANFVRSSGANGLLGKLEFYQTTAGAGAFSRPN